MSPDRGNGFAVPCFVGRILGVHAWPDRGVPRGVGYVLSVPFLWARSSAIRCNRKVGNEVSGVYLHRVRPTEEQ